MSRPQSYHDALVTGCPTRDLLDRIGSKWASLVLVALADGPLGHRELLRRIDGVSQKMLTQTLRDLERAGLVSFDRLLSNPPRSRYALTDLGRSLHALLRTIIAWADSRADEMLIAQQNYDATHRTGRAW